MITVTAISPSEVVIGSCATDAREPGQDRKVAAFIGIVCVPQIAWSSPHSARSLPFSGAVTRSQAVSRSAYSTSSGLPISSHIATNSLVGPFHCQSSTAPTGTS
jgi:hypothetical protein